MHLRAWQSLARKLFGDQLARVHRTGSEWFKSCHEKAHHENLPRYRTCASHAHPISGSQSQAYAVPQRDPSPMNQ